MVTGSEVDRLHISLGVDLTQMRAGLSQAAKDIQQSVNGPLAREASSLSAVFSGAFTRLGSEITSVALTGKISFKNMVNSIVADLARLSFQKFFTSPLTGLLNNIVGGRAGGGPVISNQAFLVGERGPELFVPSSAGRVVANRDLSSGGGAPVVVNFNFPQGADAESFKRSQSQISAMVSRALSKGQRNL